MRITFGDHGRFRRPFLPDIGTEVTEPPDIRVGYHFKNDLPRLKIHKLHFTPLGILCLPTSMAPGSASRNHTRARDLHHRHGGCTGAYCGFATAGDTLGHYMGETAAKLF